MCLLGAVIFVSSFKIGQALTVIKSQVLSYPPPLAPLLFPIALFLVPLSSFKIGQSLMVIKSQVPLVPFLLSSSSLAQFPLPSKYFLCINTVCIHTPIYLPLCIPTYFWSNLALVLDPGVHSRRAVRPLPTTRCGQEWSTGQS